MMAAKQSKKIDMGETDRISSLPRTLIDDIVAFLPIRDAARTSVLSRKWRYIWAENPQLVINKQFFRDIKRRTLRAREIPLHFVNLVNGLLLQRHAPILKFILQVPTLPSSEYPNIDRWMDFLCRQGLKELTLVQYSNKIPSHIFSCPTLEKLGISSCIFKPPPTGNEIFEMLTSLNLEKINFEPLVLSIPKLVIFRLAKCKGIRHLNISAQQLRHLILFGNDDIELSQYMNCTNLHSAYIKSSNGVLVRNSAQNERMTPEKLVRNWLQLTKLVLDASFLKYICSGDTDTEKLQTENYKKFHHLVIYGVSYDDLDEMVCLLGLIRIFFKLKTLEIWADERIHNKLTVLAYLTKQNLLINPILLELAIVKIIGFYGTRCEMLLVKLLLASGPLIERMYITEKRNLHTEQRLLYPKRLLQLSRASPVAEIILEDGCERRKFPPSQWRMQG